MSDQAYFWLLLQAADFGLVLQIGFPLKELGFVDLGDAGFLCLC